MKRKQALAYGVVAFLTAAAGIVHAQQVFKYVMPDGRIVYSDKTVPGGRLVDEIVPPPPATQPAPAANPRQDQLQEQRNAVRERLSDRNREFERASADLASARARLAEAQQRLEAGKEPLPGERTGNQGGGSRLNELYWQRQTANEAEVARARELVQRAEAELAQLR